MKKEYLEPFVEAAKTVSEALFDGKAVKISEIRERSLKIDKDVIVAIGLRGELTGIALFGVTEKDAVMLANRAYEKMGVPPENRSNEWDEMNKSALHEFGNQVLGYVTKLYGEKKYKCDITLPNLISPKQLGAYPYECVKLEIENQQIMEIKLQISERKTPMPTRI
ncbi:hypothetical protein bcgnr5378_62160 [Bacillus cereus]|uniref:Uncharacterized protein n=1 Tax=Bacillus cereus TaxID=1396 RepID=A0A164QQL2_BACCE|nr:chemotaxis protein CheX [Bacillus cereus]KZD72040.1 hypothetical protein B4088_0501 [Bacillus cereus]GCF72326.1 hypothetical protein BC2903_61450 [Bacillus cereus]HDR8321549.1 chemotaxis protein CheX [Bacillus cereus]HDR8329257.1 chemotaxis protein CheX [Bacillus cereus]HDR8333050.1 chemotaxis protein CheX [Bacillus cereus]